MAKYFGHTGRRQRDPSRYSCSRPSPLGRRLRPALTFSLALTFIFVLPFNQSFAQESNTIQGTVTAATGAVPLQAVNVVAGAAEGGAAASVLTNGAGQYTIEVPGNVNTLEFSLIGYATQSIEIAGRTEIDVAMEAQALLLDAVVAVGYATQTQRDVTGSVASLGERDFNRGVISSPEQLLQGRIAGVQVTTASGEPGAGSTIRIRGTSSVRSGNQPLIVIDGVPVSGTTTTPGGRSMGAGDQSPINPLSFLNPGDIESISVLKDASAAAIYGARASNGVILVTTKRGTAGGEPTLTVTSSMSVGSLPKKIDLLSADEYVDAGVEAGADANIINFGGSTDWQDEIYRNAVSQNQYVSYGSGSETGYYRFSMGYDNQEGIIEHSSLERLTGRINANQTLLDGRLSLDLSLTTSRLNDDHVAVGNNAGFEGDLIGAALQANPTRPVFDENSDYLQSSDFRNPMAMLAFIDDDSETNRTLANIAASLNVTDWLTYKINLGYDNADAVRRVGIDPRLDFPGIRPPDAGRAMIENRYVNDVLAEHTLNLRPRMAGASQVDVLAGFSYQRFEERGNFVQAEHFVTNEIPPVDNIDGVNNDDFKAFTGESFRNKSELQSFFGRVNYSYLDRYLLTANFRVDGSTKFGRNNKYGYFPSLAAAWNLSNEEFFSQLAPGLASALDVLKVRVGYGITGNQEFPGGAALAIFETNNDGSLTQTNNPNPDIQWEETAQFDVGLDFEFQGGRFGGSFDYFNKQTKNLIFRQDFAQPAAVDFQWVNLDGEVVNSGWELALTALPVSTSRLSWGVDYNMTYTSNEVRDLGTFLNTGAIDGQGLSGAYAQRIADGQPLYAFYMRRFEGFDSTGLGIYADNEQLAFVGKPIPDVTMGLTNRLTIGRLDVSAFLEGAFGFQIYNNTANAIFLKGNLRNGRNVTREIAASDESSNNFGEASTRFLEDGDYVRLANANIGYNFDVSRWNTFLRSLRIDLTGQNLFLITDYSGYDPEVNTDKSIDDVPSFGIDYTAYPRPRVFTLSVTASM